MESSSPINQISQNQKPLEKCVSCAKKVPVICFFSNLTLAIFKMSVGSLTGSKGLFADGVHSLSDVVATTGVIISLKVADKGSDPQHPYGRGKAEFISCVFVYSILFIVALLILNEAISSILAGESGVPHLVSLLSAIVSVIANIILVRLGLCAGRAVNSPAIIANANENIADLYSSIAVIFGIIGANLGYPICDPLAAALVGLIILKTSTTLGWKAIGALVDRSIPTDKLLQISEIVMEVDGVERINYIKSRRIGKNYWFDVEIQVPPTLLVREGDIVVEVVRRKLLNLSSLVQEVVVILSCEEAGTEDKNAENKGFLGGLKSRFSSAG